MWRVTKIVTQEVVTHKRPAFPLIEAEVTLYDGDKVVATARRSTGALALGYALLSVHAQDGLPIEWVDLPRRTDERQSNGNDGGVVVEAAANTGAHS